MKRANPLLLAVLCFIVNAKLMAQCPPGNSPDSFTWYNSATNQGAVWDPITFPVAEQCTNHSEVYMSNNGLVQITTSLSDPFDQNTDPCNPSTFLPNGVDGDYSGTYNSSGYPQNWVDGRFMLQVKASQPNQDVCFTYSFDVPITIENFQVSDIDWNAQLYDQFGFPFPAAVLQTYQDQVSFSASFEGNNVPLALAYASGAAATSSYTITGQNALANYDGTTNFNGTSGDVTPTNPAGIVQVSSSNVVIDNFTICYSNGPSDVNHPVLDNVNFFATDPGSSDDHAISLDGFSLICVTQQFTISGNVFNDANGLTDAMVNGIGIGSPDGNQLYATLIDNSNNVVASVPVNGSGAFQFNNVLFGTYTAQIGLIDESGNIGTPPSAGPSLPGGWVNTGEGLGANNPGDGLVDGKQIINVNGNLTNIDFGIEQPPTANNVLAPSQINPGGTVQVTVPDLDVSDPEDGTPIPSPTITIIELPVLATEGRLYYNGLSVTAGQVLTGFNPILLTLDPIDGTVTVDFLYSVTDNAGQESNTASVTMPFTTVSVSGNVFHDEDGLTDGFIDGTAINTVSGSQIHATLVNNLVEVIASVPVTASGTFLFLNVNAGNYTVQIGTTDESGNLGNPPSIPSLPSNWTNVGEGLGPNATGDGSDDGIVDLVVVAGNITDVDFGIEQPPVANHVSRTGLVNPGGTTQVQVPSPAVSDPEDIIPDIIVIETLPDLVTEGRLYYGGTPASTNQVIPGFDSTLLTIDPIDGHVLIDFDYSTIDNAGVQSARATIEMNFTSALPITLVSFEAKRLSSGNISLIWVTSSEQNSDYFDVERSKDGFNFTAIEQIRAAGVSSELITYTFLDESTPSETTYYRLKQVDLDSTFEYSDIIVVSKLKTEIMFSYSRILVMKEASLL